MGRVQAVRDLSQQGERAPWRERPFTRYQPLQVDAFDILHDEVWRSVDLTEVMYRDDVRMVDAGGGGGLDPEALQVAAVARELRRDQLHRSRQIERDVRRAVDDAHPAARDLLLDPVAAVEHRPRCERIRGLPAVHVRQ